MSTFLSDIDFGPDVTIYDRFYYDPSRTIEAQFDCLDQDMFQVQFDSECNLLIDVGWYDAVEPRGLFIAQVIENFNWEEPLVEIRSRDVNIIKLAVIWRLRNCEKTVIF